MFRLLGTTETTPLVRGPSLMVAHLPWSPAASLCLSAAVVAMLIVSLQLHDKSSWRAMRSALPWTLACLLLDASVAVVVGAAWYSTYQAVPVPDMSSSAAVLAGAVI